MIAPGTDHQYSVLVLYDPAACHVGNTFDHVIAFSAYSHFQIRYADAAGRSACWFDLNDYDAVIIHYSCCLYRPGAMHPGYEAALAAFDGPKILFLQDEYDNTGHTIAMIRRLGIQVFFTTITPDCWERVYPAAQVGELEFVYTLTGYAPIDLPTVDSLTPSSLRPITIGYRARKLPYRYGKLGWDKFRIGRDVKAELIRRNIPCDIEWDEDKRIYGPAWPEFLGACKATLGSESASNVFDYDGSLLREMNEAQRRDPDLTFEDAWNRFLRDKEGAHGTTSMISPRVFEAAALKTVLVMFPGRYSGVLEPGRHYIELAHDYSNMEQVIAALSDDDMLSEIAARAHADLIGSGRWSHARMVEQTTDILRRRLDRPKRRGPLALIMPPAPPIPPDRAHAVSTIPLTAAQTQTLREAALPAVPIAQVREAQDLPAASLFHICGDGRGAHLLRIELNKLGLAAAPEPLLPDADIDGLDKDLPVLISNQYVVENAFRLTAQGFVQLYNAHPWVQRLARESEET